MADRAAAGFTIYGESSKAYGLLMIDYDFPTPEVNEIEEELPFRNGTVDFTFMNNGKPTFKKRTVTFVMKAFENSYQNRSLFLLELKKWLYAKPRAALRTEVYNQHEFTLKCTNISYEIKSYGIDITFTFTGDPYIKNVITQELTI